ncbi:MAG: tRNA (guanosine(46)-N7)-methyltransferase TrmB [Candidatus Omnitrophota bacterium]
MSSPHALIGNDKEIKARKFVQENYTPIVFNEFFGNSNPVEMEIGCGKGKFLVARSIENPHTNFFGIDRVSKFMNIGKTRAQKRALPNIRFLRAEARAFLTEAIAPGSVSLFHIYFPDPWPKRRHHVRRVFTTELLKLLHARLVPGGLVEIATDDKDYFDAMKKTIAATAELWENVREAVNERILGGMNKTSYEIKWAAQGRSLYYRELKRR